MRERVDPPGLAGRLEALLLLALALGALVFAAGPRYTVLMNPSFRWVTLTGAALVVGMGIAVLRVPRRVRNRGALLAFSALVLIVALGRPYEAQGISIVPPDASPALAREGYDELFLESLFKTLSEEARDVPAGHYVAQGRMHRLPAADGPDRFVLLCPKVACCLADAVAYAVHLDLPAGDPPHEDAPWVYVYGTLRRLDDPLDTPPFRVGAISFTAVSRHYVLAADEIVDHRALLEDVTAKIPAGPCGAFREAIRVTGLVEVLRGPGPFTVFAPLDSTFLRLLRENARAHAHDTTTTGSDSIDATRLRRYLESYVVRGRLLRRDLLDRQAIQTVSGRSLVVEVVDGRPLVEGASILFADQVGRNGVVHVLHPAWPPEGD